MAGMFDDFFVRAMVGGIGVALVAGPMGCFIVWRKMAYFGDTLAHGALLGLVLGYMLNIDMSIMVFALCSIIALLLVYLGKIAKLSNDAILGLLAHASLALGLVAISFVSQLRGDLTGFLFGDILSISKTDLISIWVGGAAILSGLLYIWRPLFAATLSPEIAEAEAQKPDRTNLIFMVLMAAMIAIAMKIIGVLLITALLIIPAAAARGLATSPEQMAVFAALLGAAAVVGGLYVSLAWDSPAGPSIVVAAFLIFLVTLSPVIRKGMAMLRHSSNPQVRK